MTINRLSVQCSSNCTEQQLLAKQLSDLDGTELAGQACYVLEITDDFVQLVPSDRKISGPVFVDFVTGTNVHRQQYGGSELIAKACGIPNRKPSSILDCTAGLGRDAFVLAGRCQTLNTQIDMCEAHPVIAALLNDGLKRAREDEQAVQLTSKLNLILSDAFQHLSATATTYDVIYLDPMFPERKKSAAIKKDMLALQAVVGHHDHENSDTLLLTLARERAKQRVVVKRPSHAPYIGGMKPNVEYKGKAIRFDVYTT